MPRVDTQSIPPGLLSAYNRAFGPTRYLATNFGGKDEQRSCVAAAYPREPWQSLHPSPDQIAQRDIFTHACAGWRDTTGIEHAAYYQASLTTGGFYFNFFMSRIMRALADGVPWEDLARPHPVLIDYATSPGAAMTGDAIMDGLDHEIDIELESGPVIYAPGYYVGITDALVFRMEGFIAEPQPGTTTLIEYKALTPSDQTIIRLAYDVPGTEFDFVWWNLYRSSNVVGPYIVWEQAIDQEPTPWSATSYMLYDEWS